MEKNIVREQDIDLSIDVTDDEVIGLWKSIKVPISATDAWTAIVACEALDQLFARPKPKHIEITWQ